MSTYQCWHVDVPQEFIEAPSSFAARQEFARRHRKQVSECMARRRLDPQPRSGSIECPHCHWGIHPSAFNQHLREKH